MFKKYKKQILLISVLSCLLSSCNTLTTGNIAESKDTIINSTLSPVTSSTTGGTVGEDSNNETEDSPTVNEEPADNIPHVYDNLFPELETSLTTNTTNINYSNYINRMPVVETDEIVFQFDYNGYISLKNRGDNSEKVLHIYDILLESSVSERSNKDSDWFFMGAVLNDSAIYARYDLLGFESYSLLIRIDTDGKYAEICVANPYFDNEAYNSFTVTNDYIYYTYHSYNDSDRLITSILVSELDGTNPRVLTSFSSDYEISSLTPDDNLLYFSVKNSDGDTSILCYDISTLSLDTTVKNCTRFDFLYLYDDYLIVAATDNQLIAYKIGKNKAIYKKVCENSGLQFGNVFINDSNCYVQIFSWDKTSPTKILSVNFSEKNIGDYILFDYDYHLMIGISNESVYLETEEGYKKYDIKTKKETSL